MVVRVRCFGIGSNNRDNDAVDFNLGESTTVSQFVQLLRERHYITFQPMVVVNGKYAPSNCVLTDGDDVTIAVPASGG